ncbi:hypothetical protein [Bradyrhizobium sp. CCBAU 45389]|uniref:hypothetical protein n=1 Tax=Bradyrhizobium sp. CCBAU 45389 TaxID=858429 RepID=UPI002305457C|nr:hypothetical protein [Bradyrhizobium sp. CCBAU 45389]
MTEASGLPDDPSVENAPAASGARRANTRQSEPAAETAAARLAGQLREIARAAPLRSLAAAFVIGVLVARRR